MPSNDQPAAICRRCGREQPAPFSPCHECLVGCASSIPSDSFLMDTQEPQTPSTRGGEAQPTRPVEWSVIHMPTGTIVTTYDTKAEAEAAIKWVSQWREFDDKLEVRRQRGVA